MTAGFLVSFGGLVVVMLAFALAEKIIARSAERHGSREINSRNELAAALNRAEAATNHAQEEIARARNIALG